MEAILPYALALFPVLVVLWFVLGEFRKYFRGEQDKLYNEIFKGFAKAQGWLSFDESLQVLEEGGSDYSTAFYAAQKLGDLPPCELSERAIRALTKKLDSPEPKLRLLAAISLGRIGDVSAISSLQQATKSSPTADEIMWYQNASFDKEFHEARARRDGYSMSEIRVSDPNELHSKVRQAAAWAIQEINNRNRS